MLLLFLLWVFPVVVSLDHVPFVGLAHAPVAGVGVVVVLLSSMLLLLLLLLSLSFLLLMFSVVVVVLLLPLSVLLLSL